MVYCCFTHLHQHQLQFQHVCSSFNLSPDFCLLTLFNPIWTTYAPCIQYLPTFTPYKSTSFVGKYAIHGASGYCFTHMISFAVQQSVAPVAHVKCHVGSPEFCLELCRGRVGPLEIVHQPREAEAMDWHGFTTQTTLNIVWLVVDLPLWKMMEWKSVGSILPNIWKVIKHVPNHQAIVLFFWETL